MKLIHLITTVLLFIGITSCSEAEIPEMTENNITTMCQFDGTKNQYHFIAKFPTDNKIQIKNRGFIVGEGDSMANAKEYSENINITDNGFEGWALEDNWLGNLVQYTVRAFIVTENGKFLGTPMNINVVQTENE
ncbi:MAG: hypothetical protein IJ494_08275 [Bacteroides sp.]|nr:hypothetical protein [Bacteroides sp.]